MTEQAIMRRLEEARRWREDHRGKGYIVSDTAFEIAWGLQDQAKTARAYAAVQEAMREFTLN